MEGLKRFIGVVLIVIAVIVALQTILEPIYHTSSTEEGANKYSSTWDYINPLSAISIILGLIFGYIRLSGVGADSSVQEFIAANTLFYGFIFIAIIFFWNWFGIMEFASDFTGVSHSTRGLVWILVDAILPPLNIAMGIHLMRASE